jgi:hypothetical protein
MKARSFCWAVVLGLVVCLACAPGTESGANPRADSTVVSTPAPVAAVEEPSAAVRRFYRQHFAAGQAFSLTTLRARQTWFTPHLYDLLLADMGHPEEGIGYVEADLFVDGQEDAARFTVGPARQAHDTALVDVVVTYPPDVGNGHEIRQVTVAVLPSPVGWQIADLVYTHGSLAAGLRKAITP